MRTMLAKLSLFVSFLSFLYLPRFLSRTLDIRYLSDWNFMREFYDDA